MLSDSYSMDKKGSEKGGKDGIRKEGGDRPFKNEMQQRLYFSDQG